MTRDEIAFMLAAAVLWINEHDDSDSTMMQDDLTGLAIALREGTEELFVPSIGFKVWYARENR